MSHCSKSLNNNRHCCWHWYFSDSNGSTWAPLAVLKHIRSILFSCHNAQRAWARISTVAVTGDSATMAPWVRVETNRIHPICCLIALSAKASVSIVTGVSTTIAITCLGSLSNFRVNAIGSIVFSGCQGANVSTLTVSGFSATMGVTCLSRVTINTFDADCCHAVQEPNQSQCHCHLYFCNNSFPIKL